MGEEKEREMGGYGELGGQAIKDVVAAHPGVGEVLARHGVACVTCPVGICLFKDVLSIHSLSPEETAEVEREIGETLKGEGGIA